MNIKQLKRQKPQAWKDRKKSAYRRRTIRAMAKLHNKAMETAGLEWARVDLVDNDFPGGPLFCTVYAKRGQEPKPVPAGEIITYTYAPQIEFGVNL